jgi:hypothetical protein
MTTHNASLFFRHCILRSPRLLRRDLWLSARKAPPTWYKWSWQKFDEYGLAVDPCGGRIQRGGQADPTRKHQNGRHGIQLPDRAHPTRHDMSSGLTLGIERRPVADGLHHGRLTRTHRRNQRNIERVGAVWRHDSHRPSSLRSVRQAVVQPQPD